MKIRQALAVTAVFLALVGCVPGGSTTPPTTTVPEPTTTVVPTTITTTTTTPLPAGGKFTITNGQIIDPQGRVFVPMGANVAARVGQYETGYVFNWNGTATGRSNDVKAWGWNTVRINDICNAPANPGLDATNAGIDAFIDEYTAKQIVVMVDCHDVTGQNPTPTSASLAPLYAMQDRLAQKYKNNPYVWFNVLNEPQNDSNVANWLAVQKQTLNRLRAIAPSNIYVADIPTYGQGVETLLNGTTTQLSVGQTNVLYAWHAYGAVASYEDNFNEVKSRAAHKSALEQIKANKIPVVIGEFGDPLTLNEGTAGPPIWNRIGANAVMDHAPANGVGLLWWHATGDSGVFLTYSLMADRHAAPWSAATSGTGLSAAGRKFWELTN